MVGSQRGKMEEFLSIYIPHNKHTDILLIELKKCYIISGMATSLFYTVTYLTIKCIGTSTELELN